MPRPNPLSAPTTTSASQRRQRPIASVSVDDLSGLAPFSSLPASALSDVAASARLHTWRARATALLNRAFKDEIGVIATGRVRLVAISNVAGIVSLNELAEGDVVGLCTNLINIDSGDNLRICVDRPATIIALPKPTFMRLMRAYADFNVAVVSGLTQTVIDLQTRLFEVAALDVHARLAGRLLALASRHSNSSAHHKLIVPAPTHAMLAAEIGASREAVSRHLADLQKAKLIQSRRQAIEILDWAALEALYTRAAGGRLFGQAAND